MFQFLVGLAVGVVLTIALLALWIVVEDEEEERGQK